VWLAVYQCVNVPDIACLYAYSVYNVLRTRTACLISTLTLSLASLVVNEVDDDDDSCQNAEADRQRYSHVLPDVDTRLRVYA